MIFFINLGVTPRNPKEAFDLAEKIKMDLNNTKIG